MNTYALCCLLLAAGLGDRTQVLDGKDGIHVKGVAASTFNYQTGDLNPLRAGDGAIDNIELHLPGVSHHGLAFQGAKLAVYGKLSDRWGGYVHVAGRGHGTSWEGYLDSSPMSGLRLRMGRWIQQVGPISGLRLFERDFADPSLAADTYFGGALVETGLQLRYELPVSALPIIVTAAALEGANSISYAAGTGKEPGDLFSHMMYLVTFSADVGALWDSHFLVGGVFGTGLNWTGPQIGANHRTDIIGLNAEYAHKIGAYKLHERFELILRNFSVPKALNAMDAFAVEVITTRDNWQFGVRVDALGMITPEPPPAFDDALMRVSAALTYKVAKSNFLRLQYSSRNDTPENERIHEVTVQGVFGLGGTFGSGPSIVAPPEAPKAAPPSDKEADAKKTEADTLRQAAADCQKVLDYVKSIKTKK
jgi:hypothetical protein